MDKIKKLKGEYRKAKDKQGKTGEQPSTWEFFDAIDAILGTKPSTRPLIVIDTSETTENREETQIEEEKVKQKKLIHRRLIPRLIQQVPAQALLKQNQLFQGNARNQNQNRFCGLD